MLDFNVQTHVAFVSRGDVGLKLVFCFHKRHIAVLVCQHVSAKKTCNM